MIPIPSRSEHMPLVIQMIREGKDLSQYHRFMEAYDEQLKATMSTFDLATQALIDLAAEYV